MKLRKLIRLCMNDEYAKANEKEDQGKLKRNKATFTNNQQKSPRSSIKRESIKNDEFELFDQVGLAFRKNALTALNQD